MTEAARPPSETPRGRGRPRQPELQARLISAALDVLATHGGGGLTIERICASAGVPKATFYRRWSKAVEPVIEGLLARPRHLLYEDSGDVEADLKRFHTRLVDFYSDPVWAAWESLGHFDPTLDATVVSELVNEGKVRRIRNGQTLQAAMEAQGLSAALDADIILSVLNGIARNAVSLDWPPSPRQLDALMNKLLMP